MNSLKNRPISGIRAPLEVTLHLRENIPIWKGLTLEEKLYHIRKKTPKPIALKFWIKSGNNSLCGLDLDHIYVISP